MAKKPGRPKLSKAKSQDATLEKEKFACINCNNLKVKGEFYTSFSSASKNGIIPYCKKCLIEMVNINGLPDKDKAIEILQKIDRPFLENYWEAALRQGASGFGWYMKNLALPQNRTLTWQDGETVNKRNSIREKDEMFYSDEWLGTYSQRDIEYLDEYLMSLKKDFKIVTRNHVDYARKIAKASLAMDRAYQGMIEGNGSESRYKNLKDVFDSLSKSAQFSESERGINDVSLGCFGVLFDKVEKRKWIPEHQPKEKDMYDNLLDQFANIDKSLR
jgi:hypothetical protein